MKRAGALALAATRVRIGLWDHAFDSATGNLRNAVAEPANFIGSDTRTVNEVRVTSNGFLECLDAVEEASAWKDKFRRLPFGIDEILFAL